MTLPLQNYYLGRILSIWGLMSILLVTGYGQGVTFTASTDARQVLPNTYFEVDFTLSNAQGKNFTPPDFDGIDIQAGPSTSNQISIVNGRRSSKMTYSYGVSVPKPGRYTIEPASIEVNGKTLRTQALTIEVVKGAANNASTPNADDDIFVELELTYDTCYIGQQVLAVYNIYSREADIRSYNFMKYPTFDGFFSKVIDKYHPNERVIRDGKQYLKRRLTSYALFPQQKGVHRIPPVTVRLGIAAGRDRRSFFSSIRLRYKTVTVEGKNIWIEDLPEPQPKNYCGGVGTYQIYSNIDRTRLKKDDAITLTVQLKGNGDSKLLEAPDLGISEYFDVYEPNLLRDQSEVVNGQMLNLKTYEYLLVPKIEGDITFQPSVSYYNPDSLTYVELRTKAYSVNVAPGSGRTRQPIQQEVVTLPSIKTNTTLSHKNNITAFSSPLYWGMNGGMMTMLIGLFVWRYRQKKVDSMSTTEKNYARAHAIATQRLQKAQQALQANEYQEFYIQLRKGVTDYLIHKFQLPNAALTKDNITALLIEKNWEALTEDVTTILQKGEMALYANTSTGSENEDYQKALQIIKQIENHNPAK